MAPAIAQPLAMQLNDFLKGKKFLFVRCVADAVVATHAAIWSVGGINSSILQMIILGNGASWPLATFSSDPAIVTKYCKLSLAKKSGKKMEGRKKHLLM